MENVCLAAANGEEKTALVLDGLRDRINGKPFTSDSVCIDSAGRPHVTAFQVNVTKKSAIS